MINKADRNMTEHKSNATCIEREQKERWRVGEGVIEQGDQ